MKTSLWNIEKEYLEIMQEVEQMEGELTNDLELKLSINQDQLKSKSNAYLAVIKEKESSNKLIDDEIKRLQAIKTKNSNLVSRLKDNLLNAVKMFGEFEADFNKFGTRKSISISVLNVEDLPKEYITLKETKQPNKKLIKDALQSGKKIKGCAIEENINLKIN